MNEHSVPGAADAPGPYRPPAPGQHGAGSHPAPGSGGKPPAGASFFNWLRSLRVVRSDNRWIAGVAEGIALRTGLDPSLVRGLFVVFGLFGVGLLAYGAAWALLPESDGRIHLEEAIAGNWTAGMTGALVFSILGLGGPGVSFWAQDGWLAGTYWGVFWITGVIILVYWLSNRDKDRPRPARSPGQAGHGDLPPAGTDRNRDENTFHGPAGMASGPDASGPGATGGAGGSAAPARPAEASTGARTSALPYDPTGETAARTSGTAGSMAAGTDAGSDSWDEAWNEASAGSDRNRGADAVGGSAPDSYGYLRSPGTDYSSNRYVATPAAGQDPESESCSTTPPGSWTMLLLGVGLLTAGVLLALDYTGVMSFEEPAAVALAAAAGALGLGVVLLGCLGRSSGPAGVVAVLALAGSLVVGGSMVHNNLVVANQSQWKVDAAGSAQDGYTVVAGQGNLDLTGLSSDLRRGDVTIPVSVAAGNVAVLVPDDVPVTVRTGMLFANVGLDEDGATRSSGGIWTGDELQLNATESGNRLVLEVQGVAGNVLVTTNESEMDR